MRDIFVRAGLLVAMMAIATGARAGTAETAGAPSPGAGPCHEASSGAAIITPGWIAETLSRGLAAFGPVAGATQLTLTDQPRSAKPHQNPAFPAAFVFQSNSASYLALCVPASGKRKSSSGS